MSICVAAERRVFTYKMFCVMSERLSISLFIISFSTFETILSLAFENRYSSLLLTRRWSNSSTLWTLRLLSLKTWSFSSDLIMVTIIMSTNQIDKWVSKIVSDKTTFSNNILPSTIPSSFNLSLGRLPTISLINSRTLLTITRNPNISSSPKNLSLLLWQRPNSLCE